jgi:MFS family permease
MNTQTESLEAGGLAADRAVARAGISRAQWMVLLAAFLGWMFDGLEMGIFPIIASPALREMLPGDTAAQSKWIGYITALFLIGAACGGLVFGWLGDRLGRVKAMMLSVLAYSAFTALGYFAHTPETLGVLRFLAALGMGGEWSLGVALVMECWPEKKRPMLAGLIGAASNVGFLLIGLVSLKLIGAADKNWRWVLLAGLSPALLTVLVRWFVPESEKWKGAVAKSTARPLREIFSRGLLSHTLFGILFASIALIGTWGSTQMIPPWIDTIAGGKVPGGSPDNRIYASIFSSGGAIVGCLVAPFLGDVFNRRAGYFLLCLSSLVSCQFLFRGMHTYGAGQLALIGAVGATTAAFYGWLPLYLPELFPTRVRATGQGVSFNSGRILAAVAAITQGQLTAQFNNDFARACSVITFVYVIGMLLIWLAPETKGKPLPE